MGPPSSPGIIIGNGKQQHHILKNKSKTPLPADPIDPDFQYTISPSKSLKTKASSSNNINYYYSGNKKNNKKTNNHLNNNNYVKQNVNMSKTFSPTTTTIAKKKYNRKKQLAMTTLPKM